MPDPGRIANQRDFGRMLTLLRERAGRTIRQVASAADIPPSTAGDYFTGSHLPHASARSVLLRILAACGETDPGVADQWLEALARARRAPGRRPAGTPPPYRGLASFEVEDAQWFFGRDDLIRLLVNAGSICHGRAVGGVPGDLPVVVIGPSGAGKSSLLRAGLMPALRDRSRCRAGAGTAAVRILLFTPGSHPLARLAKHLASGDAAEAEAALRADPGRSVELAGKIRPPGLALIVDQFEDTYTDCQDEDERQAFIAALCALCGPATVVLGLRADSYARALAHPQLARALQARQIAVGPMTAAQLRQAIVEPARLAGLQVDHGLVELLLRDLASQAGSGGPGPACDAGALALLSNALLATWERSRGRLLTVAAYEASGGIREAIAAAAETAYGELPANQRGDARRLLLRLVQVTGGVAIRRRIPIDEVNQGNDPAVLERFVARRLITVDEHAAEITHEALLAAWPPLREWIDADRDRLRMRHRISEAARAWLDGGREVDGLLRGVALGVARDSFADRADRADLSWLEQEFLDASMAHERAARRAEKRRTRRLRRVVAALGAAMLATVAVAGYAFDQREQASAARDKATSPEVAALAGEVRGNDVSVAAQLGLAAYRISPTTLARSSLLDSSGTPAAARLLDSAGIVRAVALSPDHKVLAVAANDGTLRLWDVARPGLPFPLGRPIERHPAALDAAAFGQGGRLLAAAGADYRIRIWDTADPRRPRPVGPALTGPANTVHCVAFSPDGRILAAGGADETVRLWETSSSGQPRPLATLTGPAGYVESIAFSPDGTTIAAGSADGTVRLWRLTRSSRPAALGRLITARGSVVAAVAFSPDGRTLAAGGGKKDVWLWNVANPARPVRVSVTLTGAVNWVDAIAFSPDGKALAAGSRDDIAVAWNLATGAVIFRLPHPAPVTSLAWDGTRDLITGAVDGTVRLWAVPPPVLDAGSPVNSVSFSADGQTLAAGAAGLSLWDAVTRSRTGTAAVPGTFVKAVAFRPGSAAMLAAGYGNGSVQLWHTAGQGSPVPLGPSAHASAAGPVEFVAFRRDGKVLATAEADGTVRLWHVAAAASLRPLTAIPDSATDVASAVFSPNGRVLAADSADGTVRLWNVANLVRPSPLARLSCGRGYVCSVAFSPGGRLLAVGGADGTVRLWGTADPARPVLVRGPPTGPSGSVRSLAFSSDGRTLAAGVTNGTVWLWRISDNSIPVQRADLTGPAGHVYSVVFRPGGRVLAAASADGTVRLWDTEPETVAAAVCAMAGDSLTRAEWSEYIPGMPYAPPCRDAHPVG